MRKYITVVKNTWEEMLTYRLNFSLWRVRNVLQLLTAYFLWVAIIPASGEVFGYSQSMMLTYILVASFISAIVFSTKTDLIGENINKGDLSIFLTRPINYLAYTLSRDFGDKLMNISFSIVEITILFFLLKPPIFIQTDPIFLILAILAIILAVFLNFLIGFLLGLLGFWSPDVWAPRFIFFILVAFFAGGLFPLDIMPENIFNFFKLLPFTYLLYFPLKIYLGQLTQAQIFSGFSITIVWIILLWVFKSFIWQKGLRMYTSYGR